MGCMTRAGRRRRAPAHAGRSRGSAAGPGTGSTRRRMAESADPPRFDDGGRERLARAFRSTRNTVHRVVGRVAALRPRATLGAARPARSGRSRRSSPAGAGSARAPRATRSATCPCFGPGDPINPAVGRPGGGRVPRQLDRRSQLLPQRVRARAQPLRGRVPAAGGGDPDGDSGPSPSRRSRGQSCATATSTPTRSSRSRGSSSRRRSRRRTRSSGRPSSSTTSPLSLALHANWFGLLDADDRSRRLALATVVRTLGRSSGRDQATTWYSVFAIGRRHLRARQPDTPTAGFRVDRADIWSLANPDHVNGGTNHFGSPFNFPEEFVTVYRLHPMLPDLLDSATGARPERRPARSSRGGRVRGRATAAMRDARPRELGCLAWAASGSAR